MTPEREEDIRNKAFKTVLDRGRELGLFTRAPK